MDRPIIVSGNWSWRRTLGGLSVGSTRVTGHRVLIAMTLAALGLRVVVLVASARLGADEAIPGLMARHIAAAGELPVFFWGQAYFGALESYLIAALFWVLGFHWWLVFVPALIASVALVPLTWALAMHLGPWPAGFLAMLPIALASPVFSRLLGNSGGGFALGAALQMGALLCLLTAMTTHTRYRTVWLALSSFLVGLAGWVWQPALVALLPVLLVLVALDAPRARWLVLCELAPLAVGVAPLVGYNVVLGWPTALTLAIKFAELTSTESSHLSAVLGVLITAVGGGEESLGGANLPQGVLVALAFVVQPTAIVCVALRQGTRVWQARASATVLVVVVAALSAAAAHTGARHLVFPALIGFALSGALLALVAGHSRFALSAILGLACVVFGLGNLLAYGDIESELRAERLSRVRDTRAAITALEAHGLRSGYADYWTAYPITFLSGEQIVLAPTLPDAWGPAIDRYPAYSARVAAETDVTRLFLLADEGCALTRFLSVLDQADVRYRVEDVARWSLVWDFHAPPDADAAWPTAIHRAATPAPAC